MATGAGWPIVKSGATMPGVAAAVAAEPRGIWMPSIVATYCKKDEKFVRIEISVLNSTTRNVLQNMWIVSFMRVSQWSQKI